MVALHVLCIDMTCIPKWLKFMLHDLASALLRIRCAFVKRSAPVRAHRALQSSSTVPGDDRVHDSPRRLPAAADPARRVRARRLTCASTRTRCRAARRPRSVRPRCPRRPCVDTLPSAARSRSALLAAKVRVRARLRRAPRGTSRAPQFPPGNARVETFSPTPTTTACRRSPCSCDSTKTPASFLSPTYRSFGHLSCTASVEQRARSRRAARGRWPGSARSPGTSSSFGRKSTENSRLSPGAASQALPRRPRPAVCSSATNSEPCGAPERAASRALSLVEPVTGSYISGRPSVGFGSRDCARKRSASKGFIGSRCRARCRRPARSASVHRR